MHWKIKLPALLAVLLSFTGNYPLNAAELAPAEPAPAALDQVNVTGGTIAGIPAAKAGIVAYKGIPYAAPPLGQLRWAPPAPVIPWTGIHQADKFSPGCMQTITGDFGPWTHEFLTHDAVSEDCLYLNVWTPAKAPAERHPVLVFIHGGGFQSGSTSVAIYDGEGLAAKGLVVVTINYRLGVLGFLALPELTAESSHHASGDYGLMDQIAALRWVHDNIASFGGDPTRVTIAGQSAGGISVHELTASPLAHGLFQRAIIESGGSSTSRSGLSLAGAVRAAPLADAEAAGKRYAESLGASSLADLRAMNFQQLSSKPSNFAPIVDGYVLRTSVLDTFAQGKENDVPTLTGVNTGELNGFLGLSPTPSTVDAFRTQARKEYGASAEPFLKLYPASTDAEAKSSQAQSAQDSALAGMYGWAQARARTAKTETFLYLWNHAMPGPQAAHWGAFHTSEVPYVMHTLNMSDRPFSAQDHAIENTVSSYWVNFATSGDPNGSGLPRWPAFSGKPEIMQLGDHTGPVPLTSTPERLAFFESMP